MWASYFEFAANQSLSDREITYLLRDIDRKRDIADMRSEAKHRERREKRQKRKQESKESISQPLTTSTRRMKRRSRNGFLNKEGE